MRFTIEQRHLTDAGGRPLTGQPPVSFFSCEAENAEDAVRLFVRDHSAEVIGNLLTFPGFQAVATVRSAGGLFTLQAAPSTQKLHP